MAQKYKKIYKIFKKIYKIFKKIYKIFKKIFFQKKVLPKEHSHKTRICVESVGFLRYHLLGKLWVCVKGAGRTILPNSDKLISAGICGLQEI